jgi:oligosaccharyltransferase complex subunit gamma
MLLGIGTLLITAWPYIMPIIQNRNLWAAISLIAILLFISGHMFNHIRKVPYVAGNNRGGVMYFASGFQNQFGLETQIVAVMCKFTDTHRRIPARERRKLTQTLTDGVLSFCSIALAVKVPRMEDSSSQKVAVLVWGGVLFIMYSVLLSIFRMKNAGYPFALPPFM